MTEQTPPKQLRVRLATLDDVPEVARIHVQSWQRAYRGQIPDDVLDIEQRASLWRRSLAASRHVLFLAELEARVVGFCQLAPSRDAGAEPSTAEVTAIYVHPDNDRSGAGRALMAAAQDEAWLRGDQALTLWVLDTNEAARRFYERCGLRADGASKIVERPRYSLRELRYRMELGAGSSG